MSNLDGWTQSPDGAWIVTVANERLCVVDSSTASITSFDRSARPEVHFSRWSPDGERLLMARGADVVLLRVRDLRIESVFAQPGRWFRLDEGSWSPDGSTVAFFVDLYSRYGEPTHGWLITVSVDGVPEVIRREELTFPPDSRLRIVWGAEGMATASRE